MAEPLLDVRDAAVAHGEVLAVAGVSFALEPGDLVALVGPNGAGKSSLFAGLLGLAPMRGEVTLRGAFAYVPQHGPGQRSFPVTALDVALMGAYGRVPWYRRLVGAERNGALAALRRVGLEDRAGDAFGTLSGGQRQRVLLARALVQRGDVLLLDEALAGVDAVSETAILRALDEERAEGRAVLMATHDLAFARERASKVLLVNGRQFAFGPPETALTGERLRAAYGGRLVLVDGQVALDEGSHCGHEHGHAHDHEHADDVDATAPL
jgi:ABC-type Mn2+/Zn2+ transport system ATPase subunit